MLMGTKVLQSCLPVILNEEKEESWILSFEGLKVLTEFLKFCEGRKTSGAGKYCFSIARG